VKMDELERIFVAVRRLPRQKGTSVSGQVVVVASKYNRGGSAL